MAYSHSLAPGGKLPTATTSAKLSTQLTGRKPRIPNIEQALKRFFWDKPATSSHSLFI